MNIQKTNNVNFEARRIINVRKSVQNGADEVIDVFALGKEDKKFMARCNAALQADDRVVARTQGNVRRASESVDTSFRNFFKSFLGRLAGKGNDGLTFDDMTYLVAIKNGEVISGVAEATEDFYPASRIERLICTENDTVAKNGLMYGVITKLKDVLNGRKNAAIIGMSNMLPKGQPAVMPLRNCNSALVSLRANTPDSKFERVNDPHQYDLEDFLGVKDLETEIM
mgnify:CR=1 FL=1